MIKTIATELTTRISSNFELSQDDIKEYIENEFLGYDSFEVIEEEVCRGSFEYVIEIHF